MLENYCCWKLLDVASRTLECKDTAQPGLLMRVLNQRRKAGKHPISPEALADAAVTTTQTT